MANDIVLQLKDICQIQIPTFVPLALTQEFGKSGKENPKSVVSGFSLTFIFHVLSNLGVAV